MVTDAIPCETRMWSGLRHNGATLYSNQRVSGDIKDMEDSRSKIEKGRERRWNIHPWTITLGRHYTGTLLSLANPSGHNDLEAPNTLLSTIHDTPNRTIFLDTLRITFSLPPPESLFQLSLRSIQV